MDIDGIRLFVAAAEKRNISAAGRDLGLAPAVASARLAKLETQLQADLLHRSTRKVTLSQQGAAFLPYAREILAQEAAARAALGLDRAVVTGTLRFTASSTFAQLYIAPLVPKFLKTHPGIKLDLRFSDLPFDLIEGSYDLALRNAAPEENSLKSRKLADDQRILCASPAYLAEHGTPQTPDDLSEHQLIAFRKNVVKRLRGENGETGFFDPAKAGGRLTVDDGNSQKVLTLAGAGISLNSLWSVHEDLAAGKLVRVLPNFAVDDQTALWLIYPKAHVLSAKVRTFIDFLLAEIGADPPWRQTKVR